MNERAVVALCRKCKAAVRIAFREDHEGRSDSRDVSCPSCRDGFPVRLGSTSPDLDVSIFLSPTESRVFRLNEVTTETAVDGTVLFPVVFHRIDGTVSLIHMWPEPLPEVIYVGAEGVRGYRLFEANNTVVWYSEREEATRRLYDRIRDELKSDFGQ